MNKTKTKNAATFKERFEFFIYDLLTFKDAACTTADHGFFLSSRYFTKQEAKQILNDKTRTALEQLVEAKKSTGICTSHHLVPIFLAHHPFPSLPHQFWKLKTFKRRYKRFLKDRQDPSLDEIDKTGNGSVKG